MLKKPLSHDVIKVFFKKVCAAGFDKSSEEVSVSGFDTSVEVVSILGLIMY